MLHHFIAFFRIIYSKKHLGCYHRLIRPRITVCVPFLILLCSTGIQIWELLTAWFHQLSLFTVIHIHHRLCFFGYIWFVGFQPFQQNTCPHGLLTVFFNHILQKGNIRTNISTLQIQHDFLYGILPWLYMVPIVIRIEVFRNLIQCCCQFFCCHFFRIHCLTHILNRDIFIIRQCFMNLLQTFTHHRLIF